MTAQASCKVRPPPENETRHVFGIFLSPSTLLLLGIPPGSICNIKTSQGVIGPAIAWNAHKNLKDDVVQVSKTIQTLYGLKLESRISISPSNEIVADASEVAVSDITQNDSKTGLGEAERFHWAFILGFDIKKAEILSPGLVFDKVEPEKRTFQIQRINASDERVLYHAQAECKVRINGPNPPKDKHCTLSINSDGLGGLKSQLQQINDEIGFYSEPAESRLHLPSVHRRCKGGILLHGALGTGKSLVLNKIAEAGWRGVFHVDPDDDGATIVRVFTEALQTQPSVILIDSLGSTEQSTAVMNLLGKQLDRLSDSRTLVVGATRRLSDINQDLRRVNRFRQQIEIPVPDSKSRAEILKVLGELPKYNTHPTLDYVAGRTHGFVGLDLELLFDNASWLHDIRTKTSAVDQEAISTKSTENVDQEALCDSMKLDFDNALVHVHPSAMQNIFIEAPNVRWTDIGGQHEVKKVLQKALIWPFKHAEILRFHNSRPKKGLLLYGPPGCSKTMTAKAAANESGLNFLAVKGAELMSMYVGESERKLRDIFSKARAVRPSLIFFDEIDAIGAATGSKTNEGVHTVTTLLNELDGFQAMEHVYVLAATNKPEILDPALIRAGRLDRCVYVGLPDSDARRDILKINMRDMKLGDDLDDSVLAEITEGYSGAEIAQICEEARDAAIEEHKQSGVTHLVSQKHFDHALTKTRKSVTAEMIQGYEAWGASRYQS